MSRPSSGALLPRATGTKDKHLSKEHRLSSADKKKLKQERRQSSSRVHTPQEASKSEEKTNNSYSQNVIDSGLRRTPTPTKQITLEAIRRKPGYSQTDSQNESQQKVPPLIRPNSTSRRTPTPTKQVTLQAIRRKSDNYSDTDRFDWKEYNTKTHKNVVFVSSEENNKERMADSSQRLALSSSSTASSSSGSTATHSTISMATTVKSQKTLREGSVKVNDHDGEVMNGDNKVTSINGPTNESDSDQYDTDLDDDDGDSSDDDEEEEPRRAPNELFMEFLACIMQKDYKNAEKLCKMILLYEPENPEALSFQPLIEHKLQRAEAGEETSSSDDETTSSGDESGDGSGGSSSDEDSGEESEEHTSAKDSSDDSEDDDDDDDEDSDDDNDDNDDDDDDDRVTDSGLGSVSDMTH